MQAFSWSAAAACRNLPSAVFFPEHGGGVRQARRVCTHCVVRADCLAFALDNHIEHGVWGGLSERARLRLRRTGRARALEAER